jgi:hypothetical protein
LVRPDLRSGIRHGDRCQSRLGPRGHIYMTTRKL